MTLAPVTTTGSVQSTVIGRRDSDGTSELTVQESAGIDVASYIWQPWFVQVRGGVDVAHDKTFGASGGAALSVSADATLIGRINDLYGPKYDWAERMPSFYALRPHVAFYWACRGGGPSSEADYKGSATRWRFRHD